MPNLAHGFIRAIISTIVGIILSIISKEIVSNLMENEVIGTIASLVIFAISLYIITSKMKYWGILYSIGWILGLGLMYYSMASIIEWYEIISYIGISGFIIYGKIKRKI